MLLMFFLLMISWVLVLLLKVVSLGLAESVPFNREEASSYECGFDHHNLSRIPLSLRYFFLTLLFLLFDLEVILLLFAPLVVFSVSGYLPFLVIFGFLWFLLGALFYEWKDGALSWVL